MKLTDIELGKRSAWQEVDVKHRHPCRVPDHERDRRKEILLQAVKSVGTQAEVADRLGVSHQAISIWKHNSRPVPADHLDALLSMAQHDADLGRE